MNDEALRKKPLGYYFFKGEGMRRFFDMSASLIGYVSSFFTIRLLSIFQFGTFQLVLAFVSLLDSLDINNLDGPIATEMRHHFNNKEPEKAKRIFWEMAAWRLPLTALISLAVFFGANIIAHWYGKDIGLLIKIISPYFFLSGLESLASIFLKSIVRFSYWAAPAIREFAKLIFILFFVRFSTLDILHVAIAHMMGMAIEVFILVLVLSLIPYLKTLGRIRAYNRIMMVDFVKTHGKWMFLNYALVNVSSNTTPWFIKLFINTEAVAFYSLAVNLVATLQNLVPIDGIAQLFFVRIGHLEELAFLFKRSMKYMFWLGVLFAIGGFIFVPVIITFLFPNYAPAIFLFRILVLAMPVYATWKVTRAILTNLREYKALSARVILDFLIDPVSAVMFMPLFQLPGIAFDYIFGCIVRSWFLYSRLVRKYEQFRIKIRSLFVFNEYDKEFLINILKRFWFSVKTIMPRLK